MLIVGILFVLVGISGISRYKRIQKEGIEVEATVSKIETNTTGRSKFDNVFYAFTTESNEQITTRNDETVDLYKVDDKVRIIYLRSNPKKVYSTYSKKSNIIAYAVVLIGIALIVIYLL